MRFRALQRRLVHRLEAEQHSDRPRPDTLLLYRREQEKILHQQAAASNLVIRHLHIASAMDMALAVQGGAAAISVHAIHLLAHVMRDPERIGA